MNSLKENETSSGLGNIVPTEAGGPGGDKPCPIRKKP
jgi:hypothetical protein